KGDRDEGPQQADDPRDHHQDETGEDRHQLEQDAAEDRHERPEEATEDGPPAAGFDRLPAVFHALLDPAPGAGEALREVANAPTGTLEIRDSEAAGAIAGKLVPGPWLDGHWYPPGDNGDPVCG